MVILLAVIASAVMLTLSGLHFYWALGGSWGFDDSLPTDEQGKRVLNPGKIDSTIVGLALCTFAGYYAIIAMNIPTFLPERVVAYAGWVISLLFLLRAIGDFKYIGFFKRVKKTAFAKKDNSFYSPLCLVVGTIGIILELIT